MIKVEVSVYFKLNHIYIYIYIIFDFLFIDLLEVMRLKGWRYGVFIGSFVGFFGLCCYATMIRPMLNPEPYSIYLPLDY